MQKMIESKHLLFTSLINSAVYAIWFTSFPFPSQFTYLIFLENRNQKKKKKKREREKKKIGTVALNEPQEYS